MDESVPFSDRLNSFLPDQVDQVAFYCLIKHPHKNIPVDHFTCAAKNMQVLSQLFRICP